MKKPAKYSIGGGILVHLFFLAIVVGSTFRSDHFVDLPLLIVPLFPYYHLFAALIGEQSAFFAIAIVVPFILQWPMYGWFLAFGWVRERPLKYAGIILAIHVTAVIISSLFCAFHPIYRDPF